MDGRVGSYDIWSQLPALFALPVVEYCRKYDYSGTGSYINFNYLLFFTETKTEEFSLRCRP